MPDSKVEKDYNALDEAVASLPNSWYFDSNQYAQEMKAIWQRSWVYACRADELAAPLSYRTMEIGDQNIVVLRDGDGTLRAFHNACRHRGSVLCTEREGRLASKLLICPYHQWSYAVDDGRLARITSLAEPKGFDKADYPLFPVSVGEWRGCVMINLDADAQWSPETAFHRTPENLANYPLEDLVIGHTWRKTMNCNWKVFWENFNECLHCPEVHPSLGQLVPIFSRRIMGAKDHPDWKDNVGSDDPLLVGGLKKGAETWSMDGSAQGHTFEGLSDEDLTRGYTYATSLPSVFMGGYSDHVRIVQLVPKGPEQTELVSQWLFTRETLDAPDYDISNVVDFAIQVMEEDMVACELNQRGLHAAPMKQGVLMPEEYVLKRLHEWVREHLEDQ